MKNKKLVVIIKILQTIMTVLPVISLIIFNIILKDTFDLYNSTNMIAFFIIELINIIILIRIFVVKKEIGRKLIIFIELYFIITAFIPVYHTGYTYFQISEETDSDLMGVAVQENYKDIYGFDITLFVDLFN